MPDVIPADSVGLVAPQTHHFTQPLLLACGKTLDEYQLVYETYGQLNAAKSNAVLICHALSGHHHAAGYHSMDDKRPGWWDAYIGPGKPIDTNKFFVVALNNIGGCHGSTGPRSINSATGKVWGADFPMIRVRDWVASQACLADALGIDCWAAIVGGSLGGMQVMRWALQYPERIRHAIVIASALKLSTQNIAFNEAARKAIMSDPNFHDGNYLDHDSLPKNGLAIARMIGHITYLSDYAMGEKFGRDLRSGNFNLGNAEPVEFQIESYLRYQGDSFANTFDANSYLRITKALDYFDLAREYDDDPGIAFKQARAKFLVISFSTDWRFAPERSREIVNALIGANKAVTYAEIESKFGHDAFLLPDERYQQVFARYMAGVSV
jgi:homoserine O-acetyltransferase/O-succinyltransferase